MVSQIQSNSSVQHTAVDFLRTAAPVQSIPAAVDVPVHKPEVSLNQEQVKQNLEVAINRLNEQMRDGGRNVKFSVDKELGRFVVRVTKEDTGEVIRQIPNEAVLKAGHTVEALRGMLHNQVV